MLSCGVAIRQSSHLSSGFMAESLPSAKADAPVRRSSFVHGLNAALQEVKAHPIWVLTLAAVSCIGFGWEGSQWWTTLNHASEAKVTSVTNEDVQRYYIRRDTVLNDYILKSALAQYVPRSQFEQLEAANRELEKNRLDPAQFVSRSDFERLSNVNRELERRSAAAQGFEDELANLSRQLVTSQDHAKELQAEAAKLQASVTDLQAKLKAALALPSQRAKAESLAAFVESNSNERQNLESRLQRVQSQMEFLRKDAAMLHKDVDEHGVRVDPVVFRIILTDGFIEALKSSNGYQLFESASAQKAALDSVRAKHLHSGDLLEFIDPAKASETNAERAAGEDAQISELANERDSLAKSLSEKQAQINALIAATKEP